MKTKHELYDDFDNDQAEHFTHYDYLLQVIVNGQPTALKEHLKDMSNNALLKFSEIMPDAYCNIVMDEIKSRMK